MFQGIEIVSICNGLFQMLAVWQHADFKPLSYNRIGASAKGLCHRVNCRVKEVFLGSKEFYGESHIVHF